MKANQVVQQGDGTFTVHLKTPTGHLRLVPGFASEHEADAWMVQIDRMFLARDPHSHVTARTKGAV